MRLTLEQRGAPPLGRPGGPGKPISWDLTSKTQQTPTLPDLLMPWERKGRGSPRGYLGGTVRTLREFRVTSG